MSYPTWKNLQLPASMLINLCMLAGIVAIGTGCSSDKGYPQKPLRMGAEYRFEDGLRKEKHPQYLFDKKTRKDLAKMGLPTGEPNVAPPEAPVKGAPGAGSAMADSAKVKTTPAAEPVMDTVFKVRPQ